MYIGKKFHDFCSKRCLLDWAARNGDEDQWVEIFVSLMIALSEENDDD